MLNRVGFEPRTEPATAWLKLGVREMIPMVDLKRQYAGLKDEIDSAIRRVMESTHFVLGPEGLAFEREVAEYLGVAHAVGCASGTDALCLALTAAGIGAGDEVVTTPFTFAATAEAICRAGAKPVFADIDPRTFNLDARCVAAALTPRTAAILPVHLFGQVAEVAALRRLCDTHGLLLVEDCAQAFGGSRDGVRAGGVGDFGCFSFFPSKNLGCCGDGGLVCTHSDELAERLRVLRNHGRSGPHRHEVLGYSSRLDEIQAAVLRVKLRYVDRFNVARRGVAHRYNRLLTGLDLVLPHEDPAGFHVFHQYTVLCDERDTLIGALGTEDVASAIHYRIPLHRQGAFSPFCVGVSMPVSEGVAERCLSLPIYPEMPEEQIVRVAEVVTATLA